MLTALDMLRARRPDTKTSAAEAEEGANQDDIAIVPLAMPLLAGPGAIATVMVLMAQHGAGLEAGVPVVDAHGRDLIHLDPSARRTPVAAATPALLDQLVAARNDHR
jgi:hypothetical protein